jgi:hypothetical protein
MGACTGGEQEDGLEEAAALGVGEQQQNAQHLEQQQHKGYIASAVGSSRFRAFNHNAVGPPSPGCNSLVRGVRPCQ